MIEGMFQRLVQRPEEIWRQYVHVSIYPREIRGPPTTFIFLEEIKVNL